MTTMATRAALLLTALLAALPLGAQCSNLSGVSFGPYGAGCTGFNVVPAITGSYDSQACTVSFTLTHSVSCCNTYLNRRVIVFGAAPVQVPIPFLTCDLLVSPDVLVEILPTGSDTFVFPIPNVPLAGLTLYVQGANVFFTTIGFTYDYEVSNGLVVSAF
jgi:hypothetical protein